MSNPAKRIKFEDFMKLSKQQRRLQSDYFRKNKPSMIPVVLSKKSTDLPDLPNCKFLLNLDNQMFGELNALRSHIIKNSQGKLNAQQGLFFSYNKKLLNSNIKVVDFVAKWYNDSEKDGWLHIIYDKQQIFG